MSNVTLKVVDQSYITDFMTWNFEPMNDTCWSANFTTDYDFWKDVKPLLSLKSTHPKWEEFRDTYFYDPDNLEDPLVDAVKLADDIKSLATMYKNTTDDITFGDISFDMSSGSGTFDICFNSGIDYGMLMNIGFGTTTIVTGGTGDGFYSYSWKDRVVYDPINKRWHVFFIDSGNDIHSASSLDGITWDDGLDISDIVTYNYEDFDVVLDLDTSNTYVHIAYTDTNTDEDIHYRRLELTGSGSYISVGGEQTIIGDNTKDDAASPSIMIDSNDCVYILADVEDDSEVTADEHEMLFYKEAATCGGR